LSQLLAKIHPTSDPVYTPTNNTHIYIENKTRKEEGAGREKNSMAAEGSSGSSGGGGGRKTPSPHKARERGAAKFLAGLPSRGNFSSSSISSNLVWTRPR
jgi:hypothetical protein